MWREQAIIEWSRWSDLGEWPLTMLVNLVNSWLCLLPVTTRVISIVACCHGAKLCAHAARDFRSQQNGAVTRMWRSCGVQHSHKNLRSVWLVVKRRGCCCNLSGGVALIVWFTTNGMCAKNKNICMWREQAIIEWSWWVTSNACEPGEQLIVLATGDDESDLYCYLLPRCEALRTCRSGFPIATIV